MSPVDLSYRFEPEGDTYRSLQDAASVRSIIAMEAWQIRERCFREIVDFRVGTLDLGQRVAAPVLDLAMSLEFTVKVLAMDGTATVDAPGSSWRVGMVRSGDAVTVSFGQHADGAECSFADLAQAVGLFMRDVMDNLTGICPDLLLNDEIERLFRESGAIYLGRDRFLRHDRAMGTKHGRL
jgi:hypothetical protein